MVSFPQKGGNYYLPLEGGEYSWFRFINDNSNKEKQGKKVAWLEQYNNNHFSRSNFFWIMIIVEIGDFN